MTFLYVNFNSYSHKSVQMATIQRYGYENASNLK